MALTDDLKDYIAKHGKATTDLAADAEVVIVGESHQGRSPEALRTTSMRRLLRELLSDPRFRYFGNESFQNAGPVRGSVRDYWLHAVLPPGLDLADPGVRELDDQEFGRRVMPHRFKPILEDLRAKPRYILAIGSRTSGDMRDRRLAQHFFEEIQDRGIPRHTPGVLLLGVTHAAAAPFHLGRKTTRMILEQHGYKCVSIRIMTDETRLLTGGGVIDDEVFPLQSGSPPGIRLASLAATTPVSFSTRHPSAGLTTGPFHSVREEFSESGQSIAELYEHVVLESKVIL